MNMTLSEYTARRGAMKVFLIDSGLAHSTVRNLMHGERFASIAVAVRIEKATGGAVSAESVVSPEHLPVIAYLRGQHA